MHPTHVPLRSVGRPLGRVCLERFRGAGDGDFQTNERKIEMEFDPKRGGKCFYDFYGAG